MSYQDRCRQAIGLALVFTSAGMVACSAADESETLRDEGRVARAEQPVIPGAAVTRVSQVVQLGPGTIRSVTNNCPTNSVVVGGGYIGSVNVRAHVSRASGNGWLVTAQNLSTVQTLFLNTEAECLTGTNATQVQASSSVVTLRPLSVGCPTATCPTGSIAVNGGWSGGTRVAPYISQPIDGRTWGTCAKNYNFPQSASFQSFATCLRGVTGSVRTFPQGVTVPANQVVRLDAGRCGNGLLLGGGVFRVVENGLQAIAVASNRSFQDPTQWQTQIFNPNTSSMFVTASNACLDLSP